MDKRESLSQINQQWQQDDEAWSADIERWHQDAQRWVAFIYMLEKNLPEHSAALSQHKLDIQLHQKNLFRFRCGLDDNCLQSCPSYLTEAELIDNYADLENRHTQMKVMHDQLNAQFEQQKQTLRELAQRLLEALD